MADDDALFQKGMPIRREVLGPEYVDASMARADEFMMSFQRATTTWAWAWAWGDATLDRKTTRILPRPAFTITVKPAPRTAQLSRWRIEDRRRTDPDRVQCGKADAVQMNAEGNISKICGGAGTVLDVLFIHGLTGDPFDTWTAGVDKQYWPKWICEAFPGVSAYALGYPASLLEKWAKREMNLHERANNMLEQLASKGIGDRPIAIVTHSLGGIIAKEMLRTSNECSDTGWRRIAENTRLAVFMATPHTGASLASVVKFFIPRLSSTFVDLLGNSDGYLTNLNQSYRDLANGKSITTISYYEKYKTKGMLLVVSPESADPGVGKTRPVAVDADHITICKPANRDALIFTSLCRHLKEVLKECSACISSDTFAPDDYSVMSEIDRRDLLQKLIDAGREHEYQRANGLQNKFAQRYYKLGLYTEAKAQSDAILASVEQRFVTHVYTNKICKRASNDEIAAALQLHVIDAVCASSTGKERPSATAVLQALYFLTEQCYIQWDAP